MLLLIALLRLDRESLIHSIRQIPLSIALLLLALQMVSQLMVTLQWHQIAKLAKSSLSFRDIFYINCQGTVVDALTPGVKVGGEVARALQISRMGSLSGEQAVGVVAVQKLFSVSALFFIQLFTVGYLIGALPVLQATHLQLLIYAALLFSSLLFASIFFIPHHLEARLQARAPSRFSWVRRVRGFVLTLLGQVIDLRKSTKATAMLAALSVFIWLLYPVKMYILAAQISPDVNAVYVGAVAFVSYMVAMLPIFPGGLGGFEGTMTGLLVATGYLITDAAVIAILFRLITFWFVVLLSLAFIAFYKARYKN